MQCKLCLSDNLRKKFTIKNFDVNFDIMECMECGFQFRDISENEAYDFYNEGYYNGSASFSYIDERKIEEASRNIWKKRIAILKSKDKSRDKVKNFLDIGCSFGGLLQTAGEAGYVPYGMEISKYSGKYAQERFGSGSVWIGNIENLELPGSFFQ